MDTRNNGGNMLSAFVLIGSVWAGEWESLGVTNDVAVYRKQEEGTGLYAFKGEATSDLPVGQLIGILRNESISKEWVDMMMFSTVVETYSENHLLLHQGYDLPWPVSDRDYVFDKKVVYNAEKKTATVHLTSVESSKVPVSSDFVRARGERTFWQFSVAEDGKTKIVVEVLTDPEGSLPDWAVNSIQADWPHKSITNLVNRASKGDIPHDKNTIGWQ